MYGFTVEQHHALLHRSLCVIRTGVLACLRCGGSGQYHTYGRCFRCHGGGVDPAQPKRPEKSKTLARQRDYARRFDANGYPLPHVPYMAFAAVMSPGVGGGR